MTHLVNERPSVFETENFVIDDFELGDQDELDELAELEELDELEEEEDEELFDELSLAEPSLTSLASSDMTV